MINEVELVTEEQLQLSMFLKEYVVQDVQLTDELKICVSCEGETSGAHSYRKCGLFCHAVIPCCAPMNDEVSEGYGCTVLCRHCFNSENIHTTRLEAKGNQEMLETSTKRFKPAEVGDTVMVPIPDADRGRAEFRNAKAVVVSVEENGF